MNQPDPPTLTPQSAGELASMLRAAADAGHTLVPWGAGTLQHLGGPALPEAGRIGTRALSRVLDYTPADMTITVEAGATLGEVQATLRPHGQWLPWDPPAPEQATIGGLLAAGVSGPLRLGYGTPRDWVLGMRVALADGRLVRSGGKVVKNVAGYDMHKLHIGALGTLGVIAEVTFKIAPLPEQVAPLLFTCPAPAVAFALIDQLRARPLAPISLIVSAGRNDERATPGVLLAVRFAGGAAAVARQVRLAESAADRLGAPRKELDDEHTRALWPALAGFAHPSFTHRNQGAAGALIIRAGAPAAALAAVVEALEQAAPPGCAVRVLGYGGIGLAYARWYLSNPAVQPGTHLAALRARLAQLGGYAVVEGSPALPGDPIDRWGPPPATLALMRTLKARWDPQGVLNRERYIGGI